MSQERQASFGPNAWLVDEMYEQYRADPSSVTESWRDFFADYRTDAAPPAPAEPAPAPAAAPQPAPQAVARPDVRPLRGGAARLVANMEASLAVPTATSARAVPARLLEVNRKVLNGYMARTGGNKVSFTHLIGFAVIRALDAVPAMRSVYVAGDNGQAGV
ncbi:MAG TPA: 2-oxo acid dehydrogenase subunit E2, partial [Acidimicrobiales bacterium]|nr:2-oxo acid dehydrogenase subunit E2 [Acidimicrobiales bacterium]